MSVAERLFTGACTALFTAATMAMGYGTQYGITESFREVAAGQVHGGDIVLDSAACLALIGLTLLTGSGAIWMGKNTIHPD